MQVSAKYTEHAETEAYSYTELHTVSEDFYHIVNDKKRDSGGGASIGYKSKDFSFGLSGLTTNSFLSVSF